MEAAYIVPLTPLRGSDSPQRGAPALSSRSRSVFAQSRRRRGTIRAAEENTTANTDSTDAATAEAAAAAAAGMAPAKSPQQLEIERLRAAEKFIEIETENYECGVCGYTYEPKRGESLASIPAGTPFADIPESFRCPACKSTKARFRPAKRVIAGFAENQKYGFGGNTLTAGQKNGLIFGVLAVLFVLLLSGYALN
eukprot:Plantae.Rhodophyta-Rhodochaete_pulchella.ctg18258.p1 GENE.Plantae.Rhodophyta-Rhodochaete_pulchella.ctg18258~~Plantae.Rhodophyta-Rhodochaete_pulchella.ctg18258.p1  ORF type:complete len:203 (+),score=25.04 Plantae.Rhodophyta-Rhodochaete_pulchella.ctg18258:24-611(+)